MARIRLVRRVDVVSKREANWAFTCSAELGASSIRCDSARQHSLASQFTLDRWYNDGDETDPTTKRGI